MIYFCFKSVIAMILQDIYYWLSIVGKNFSFSFYLFFWVISVRTQIPFPSVIYNALPSSFIVMHKLSWLVEIAWDYLQCPLDMCPWFCEHFYFLVQIAILDLSCPPPIRDISKLTALPLKKIDIFCCRPSCCHLSQSLKIYCWIA